MLAIKEYLQSWRLKLSLTKITASTFHFNSKEADCDLDVWVAAKWLLQSQYPVYLGIQLDQLLQYHSMERIRCKVAARKSLLCCLAGTSCVASTPALHRGAMAIVNGCSSAIYQRMQLPLTHRFLSVSHTHTQSCDAESYKDLFQWTSYIV